MNNSASNFSEYLSSLRPYRGRALAIGLILVLVSVGLAYGLPSIYRSSATILIEQQEIPTDLVRSTITSFADERLQTIAQRVMTRANLTAIVEKFDLYRDIRKKEPMEVVIEKFRENVKMAPLSADVVDPRSGRPTQATIAFSVSYDNASPIIAQKVASELASLYLNENLRDRTEVARQTSEFLGEESDRLRNEISDLDKKMAAFKKSHVTELPEMTQLNIQLWDRTEHELMDMDREISELQDRKSYIKTQLALVAPIGPVFGQSGDRIMGPADRLKQLKTRYYSLAAAYSDDHPEVKRAKRELEILKKEIGDIDDTEEKRVENTAISAKLDLARAMYADSHPGVQRLEAKKQAMVDTVEVGDSPGAPRERPDNPAYIQLQTQLKTVDTQFEAALHKQSELKDKLKEYSARVTQSPMIEKQFKELTRDYENAWMKYKEVKAKEMEAKLAQVMETERKGERFTLIEPPQVPERPLRPNRSAILVLGMLVSVAGGIGSAAVTQSADRTVRAGPLLGSIADIPVLAVVPKIETLSERKRRVRVRWVLIAGCLAILAIVVISIHFLVMPVDVLWFALQRRYFS